MHIEPPTHWRTALSKLHHGDTTLLISVLKDAVKDYHRMPDLLKEAEATFEQLAVETLQKQFRNSQIDHDISDVRHAIRTAVEWATAEAALPEFTKRIERAAAVGYGFTATMMSSIHAIVELPPGSSVHPSLDLFWVNGQWQIGGAHVDAASLHSLTQQLGEETQTTT